MIKQIFSAELTEDKKIKINITTNSIATLVLANKMLEIEINGRLINLLITDEVKSKPTIVTPDNGGLNQFLKRKKFLNEGK